MRTLLTMSFVVTLFAQPLNPFASLSSGEQPKGTKKEQPISQNDPPKSAEAFFGSAPPKEPQAEANASKRNDQTKCPWREYFRKAFSADYLSNWVLAFFALIAAGIALKTLNEIRAQTNATRIAADAAVLNAKALINSERPWLLVTIEQRATAPHIYDVQARNAGRTPAALVDGHCLWKRCPTDFALPDALNDPITIPAQNLIVNGDGFPVRTINLSNPVALPDEEGIGGDPQPPHVYGRLRYWDTFVDRNAPGAKPYVTEWMFWYDQAEHRFRSDGRYAKNT